MTTLVYVICFALCVIQLCYAALEVHSHFEYPALNELRLKCDVGSSVHVRTVMVKRLLDEDDSGMTQIIAQFQEKETFVYNGLKPRTRYSHKGLTSARTPAMKKPILESYEFSYSIWIHVKNITEHDFGQYVCIGINDDKESTSSEKQTLKNKPHHIECYGHRSFADYFRGRHGKRRLAIVATTAGLFVLLVTITTVWCCCCRTKARTTGLKAKNITMDQDKLNLPTHMEKPAIDETMVVSA